MADNQKLDPTPGDTPKSLPDVLTGSMTGKAEVPTHVKKEVAKRKPKEMPEQRFTKDSESPVTIEQYHSLMEDRPIKFGPTTAGLVRGGGKKGNPCSSCIHWYTSPAMAIALDKPSHSTCEIVRESDSADEIMADDTCNLFSKNGIDMPLLKSPENEE
jgi:hypothetical protein